MSALVTPPFYLSENDGIFFHNTIGGLDTSPNTEVLDLEGNPIPNLYAIGVDGVQLYSGFYTIDIPGSCNANNINSGRTAAQQALAQLS